MGRFRTLITPIAAAALIASGLGCKGTGWKTPEGVPTAPLSSQVKPEANPVVQAGGISPFTGLPSSLNWLAGKSGEKATKGGGNAAEIAVAWHNYVEYLPDPTKQGAMGPGLVGQMFLFDSRDYPAQADGTLTVDLYDETMRPNGQPGLQPERWQFRKDILKTLRTVDERFGPNYVLFLPWRNYRPDVTSVRITVRFDPDTNQKGAFTLYAPESKFKLDPSLAGRDVETRRSTVRTERVVPFGDRSLVEGATANPTNGMGTTTGAVNSIPAQGPGGGVVQMNRPAASQTISPPPGLPSLAIINPTGR